MLHKVRNSEEAGYDCAARIIQVNWRVAVGTMESFQAHNCNKLGNRVLQKGISHGIYDFYPRYAAF